MNSAKVVLTRGTAYQIGAHHVSGSLHCGISARLMSAAGQNPNAFRMLARRLPPATDIPATLAWAVECQEET
jgi:hypothetical protein